MKIITFFFHQDRVMRARKVLFNATYFFVWHSKTLGPLPNDVTHVILESVDMSTKQLEKKLNCENILSEVIIVHKSWLIECVLKSDLIDESNHIVKLSNDAGPELSANIGATTSSSSASSASSSDDMSRKKQKTDSFEGHTPPSSCKPSMYPMIPNPIFFPDFEPVYASWQRYRSTLYKFYDRKKDYEETGETVIIERFLMIMCTTKLFLMYEHVWLIRYST